jgi:hypothetical protein
VLAYSEIGIPTTLWLSKFQCTILKILLLVESVPHFCLQVEFRRLLTHFLLLFSIHKVILVGNFGVGKTSVTKRFTVGISELKDFLMLTFSSAG